MTDYRDYVEAFGQKMLDKLIANKHKGTWDDIDLEQSFSRLMDEVKELKAEVHDCLRFEEYDINNLIYEAADVANFALIITSVALRRRGKDLVNTTLIVAPHGHWGNNNDIIGHLYKGHDGKLYCKYMDNSHPKMIPELPKSAIIAEYKND